MPNERKRKLSSGQQGGKRKHKVTGGTLASHNSEGDDNVLRLAPVLDRLVAQRGGGTSSSRASGSDSSDEDESSSSEAEVDEHDAITRGLQSNCSIDQLFSEIVQTLGVGRHVTVPADPPVNVLQGSSNTVAESVLHDHGYADVFERIERIEANDVDTSEIVPVERVARPSYEKIHKKDVKQKFSKEPGQPAFSSLTDAIFLQQIKDHFQAFMPDSLNQDSFSDVMIWLSQKLDRNFEEFVEDENVPQRPRKPFRRTGLVQHDVERLCRRQKIVDDEELLSDSEILAEQYSFNDLLALSASFSQLFFWLVRHRLIANSLRCSCGTRMELAPAINKRHGIKWRCRRCRRTATVLYGSFFYKTHMDVIQVLMLTYLWTRMISGDVTHNETRVQSKRTRAKYLKLFREICGECLIRSPVILGGIDADGFNREVEIDESMFFKLKHHKGKSKPIQQWVFGLVERGSNKCLLVPVQDRTAATLLAIIKNHVLPGTIVLSDGWRAYTRMKDILVPHPSMPSKQMYAYENRVVEHKYEFKAADGTHTNTVEGLWRQAKLQFRVKNGLQVTHLHANLVEFCWRRRNLSNDLFLTVLKDMAQIYDVANVMLEK